MGDCKCGSSLPSSPLLLPASVADLGAQQICTCESASVTVGSLSSLLSLSMSMPSLCAPPSLPDRFRLRGILFSETMSRLRTFADGVIAPSPNPSPCKAAGVLTPVGLLQRVATQPVGARAQCVCIISWAVPRAQPNSRTDPNLFKEPARSRVPRCVASTSVESLKTRRILPMRCGASSHHRIPRRAAAGISDSFDDGLRYFPPTVNFGPLRLERPGRLTSVGWLQQ